LAKSLTAEQTDTAMASLGTFNRNWDVMMDALAKFNLEPAKADAAFAATEKYVIALGKIRKNAEQAGADRTEVRKATQEARTELSDAMKQILTEEQFGQFQRSLMPGRGRGPGMRGGEGTGKRRGA